MLVFHSVFNNLCGLTYCVAQCYKRISKLSGVTMKCIHSLSEYVSTAAVLQDSVRPVTYSCKMSVKFVTVYVCQQSVSDCVNCSLRLNCVVKLQIGSGHDAVNCVTVYAVQLYWGTKSELGQVVTQLSEVYESAKRDAVTKLQQVVMETVAVGNSDVNTGTGG